MKFNNELDEVFPLKLIFETVEAKEGFIAELKEEYLDDVPFFSIKKITGQSLLIVFEALVDELDFKLFLDFLEQFYFESIQVKDVLGDFVLLSDIQELLEEDDGLNPVLQTLVVWYSSQF